MPLISRRPPAARRLTAASFSKPSSARNSAFWSSRAPGSRNRVTQRANRAASVSCVDIGSVNLGGTPTPGNAAGFREHHATDRYTGMPATGPIVRALRAAHLHDAPRADLLRLACEKIRGLGPPYTSVYAYMLQGDDLVLGPGNGAHPHSRRARRVRNRGRDRRGPERRRCRRGGPLPRLQPRNEIRIGRPDPPRSHHSRAAGRRLGRARGLHLGTPPGREGGRGRPGRPALTPARDAV